MFVEAEIHTAAKSLAPGEVRSVRSVAAGANSRIFCVESSSGVFALKSYPVRHGDTRQRGEIEWQALHFLSRYGLTAVPTPLARDVTGRFLLMEWINGAPITAPSDNELEAAMKFVQDIFAASSEPDAAAFPPASEACLCAADILMQIEQRLHYLREETRLDAFMANTFRPLLALAKSRISAQVALERVIGADQRRLIPADFGFHNVLRETGGRIRYLDFEYFGWDDPVKLTADFLLHPAMQLTAAHRDLFTAGIAAALSSDLDFTSRLKRHLPLLALRWVLILFNPFRSDRNPGYTGPANDALFNERMAKAKILIAWAQE